MSNWCIKRNITSVLTAATARALPRFLSALPTLSVSLSLTQWRSECYWLTGYTGDTLHSQTFTTAGHKTFTNECCHLFTVIRSISAVHVSLLTANASLPLFLCLFLPLTLNRCAPLRATESYTRLHDTSQGTEFTFSLSFFLSRHKRSFLLSCPTITKSNYHHVEWMISPLLPLPPPPPPAPHAHVRWTILVNSNVSCHLLGYNSHRRST